MMIFEKKKNSLPGGPNRQFIFVDTRQIFLGTNTDFVLATNVVLRPPLPFSKCTATSFCRFAVDVVAFSDWRSMIGCVALECST